MEAIKKKLEVLLDTLKTLEDGVAFFHESEEIFQTSPTKQNERIFLSARDSIIQRFEYSIDLFWETLKIFLDNEKVALSMVTSREIIRACVEARFLSEDEGNRCMRMVNARNKTSHIYHETMAEEIARQVPDFYELMQEIAERIEKRLK